MEKATIHLQALKDTEKIGVLLGTCAKPGDVICLDGDLGAGKTALSQAIARGLDVPESCYVTSPSFAILHEYEGRIPMYHMDFYRLQDADEVADLGFDEYFYLNGLTVIEWSKRATSILPQERLSLEIKLEQDLSRSIFFHATSEYAIRLQKICQQFMDQ